MEPKWSLHPPSIDFRGVHASLDYTLFDYLRLDYYFGQEGHLDYKDIWTIPVWKLRQSD